MIIEDKRIPDLLPEHYREAYPRFVLFLEKYYDWLFRSSGLSAEEIADLRKDTSWLQNDIDRFIAAGDIRFIDPNTDANVLEQSIINLANTLNPGERAGLLSSSFSLDNEFEPYKTSDGSAFTDINDATVELSSVENNILDSWFNSMGFDRIKRHRINSLDSIDQVLMLSMLKHIYAIKGTEKSIKLFFSLYFNENVTIYQPKSDISVIDDSWLLESGAVIRDDVKYQEYSYVIRVSQAVSFYEEIVESIFIRNIHPAGFRFVLEQI